jgi:hypothetical protein
MTVNVESDLRVLLAACDMAVMRALELVGKRVARDGRARYGAMQRSGKDWHQAHEVWPPERHHVEAALSGAWNVLPRMVARHGCCSLKEPDLAAVLDAFVRETVYAQRPYQFEDLERAVRRAVEG